MKKKSEKPKPTPKAETKRTFTIRLWGDEANASDYSLKKMAKRIAANAGLEVSQIVFEKVTPEIAATQKDHRSKRGGVDGGTGKDAQE